MQRQVQQTTLADGSATARFADGRTVNCTSLTLPQPGALSRPERAHHAGERARFHYSFVSSAFQAATFALVWASSASSALRS